MSGSHLQALVWVIGIICDEAGGQEPRDGPGAAPAWASRAG